MVKDSMANGEMLKALEEREGGPGAAARAVKVNPATWSNWKGRSLPTEGHLRVWLALNAPKVFKRWLEAKP